MRLSIIALTPELRIPDLEVPDENPTGGSIITAIIARIPELNPSAIRLIYQGRLLGLDETLASRNIVDSATVHLVHQRTPSPAFGAGGNGSAVPSVTDPTPGAGTGARIPWEGLVGTILTDGANVLNVTSAPLAAGGGAAPYENFIHQAINALTQHEHARNNESGFTSSQQESTAGTAHAHGHTHSHGHTHVHFRHPPLTGALQQRPASRQNQPSAPGVEGIHLHVHCNLDELDTVPGRIQRLQRQLEEQSRASHPTTPIPITVENVRRTANGDLNAAADQLMEEVLNADSA